MEQSAQCLAKNDNRSIQNGHKNFDINSNHGAIQGSPCHLVSVLLGLGVGLCPIPRAPVRVLELVSCIVSLR